MITDKELDLLIEERIDFLTDDIIDEGVFWKTFKNQLKYNKSSFLPPIAFGAGIAGATQAGLDAPQSIGVGAASMLAAAIIHVGWIFYKEHFQKIHQTCKKFSGIEKDKCRILEKIKGCNRAIKELQTRSQKYCPKVKNKKECISKVNDRIVLYKNRIKKLNSDLKKLG